MDSLREDQVGLLIGYLEGDLPPAESERVKGMLASDARLMAEFRKLKAQDALLAGIAEEAWEATGLDKLSFVPPTAAEISTARRGSSATIKQIETKRPWWSRQSFVAAAAMAFAVVGIAYWVSTPTVPDTGGKEKARPAAFVVTQTASTHIAENVLTGEWVSVAEGESIQLQTTGEGDLVLAGPGRLRFSDPSRVVIDGGTATVSVKYSSSAFVVETGGYSIEAVRNASFVVTRDNLNVRSGEVTLRDGPTGPPNLLKAGTDTPLASKSVGTLEKAAKDAGYSLAPVAPATDSVVKEGEADAAAMHPASERFPGSQLSSFLPVNTTTWVVINDPREAAASLGQYLRPDGQLGADMRALLGGLQNVALSFRTDSPLPMIVGQMKGAEAQLESFVSMLRSSGKLVAAVPEVSEFDHVYRVRLDLGPRVSAASRYQYVGAQEDIFFFCPSAEDLSALASMDRSRFSESEFYRQGANFVDDGSVALAIDMPTLVNRVTSLEPEAAELASQLGISSMGPVFMSAWQDPTRTYLSGRFQYGPGMGVLGLLAQPSEQKLLNTLPDTCYFALSMGIGSFRDAWDTYSRYLIDTQYRGNEGLFNEQMLALRDSLGVDLPSEVFPTLGEEAAVALFESEGKPEWLVAAKIVDQDKLTELLDRMAAANSAEHDPTTGAFWTSSYAWTVQGDAFLLSSTRRGLNSAVTYKDLARVLGKTESVQQQIDPSQPPTAFLYLDLNRLASNAVRTSSDPNQVLSPLDQAPLLMSFRPKDDKIEMKGAMPPVYGLVSSVAGLIGAPGRYIDDVTRDVATTRQNLSSFARLLSEYVKRNHRMPADTSELHRAMAELRYVPEDIFAPGTALPKYYQDPITQEIRVWSVGPDGRDDGGKVLYNPDRGLLSRGDIVESVTVR